MLAADAFMRKLLIHLNSLLKNKTPTSA